MNASRAIDILPIGRVVIDNIRVRSDALTYLRKQLHDIVMPAFILEANLARINTNNLSRYPSSDRLAHFAKEFHDESKRSWFWNRYPVLWRLASTLADQVTLASIETLQRVCIDSQTISTFLGCSGPLSISSVAWNPHESHCRHRVVAIVDTGAARFVYKPKSLAADGVLNEILRHLSPALGDASPQVCWIIDKKTYGYTQFVQKLPILSHGGMACFYEKLGAILAVSWLLGITDLHHENLIASSSDPMLIDVEAMFDRAVKGKRYGALDAIFHEAAQSILYKTGLLPARQIGQGGIFDVSAIGARGTQPAPVKVLNLVNDEQDDARFIWSEASFQQAQNVPVSSDDASEPHLHLEEVIGGFGRAIDAMTTDLAGIRAILMNLDDIKVRHVPRGTLAYTSILRAAVHPTALVNGLRHDLFMLGSLANPRDWPSINLRLTPHELEALRDGDVPYFWTSLRSKDLHSDRGGIISDFFCETGEQSLVRRLEQVGSYREARSAAITFAIVSAVPPQLPTSGPHSWQLLSKSSDSMIERDAFLQHAKHVGHMLTSRAVYVDGIPFWPGLRPLDRTDYTADLLPITLYDGSAGIGLFLAYLHRITGEERSGEAAAGIHRLIKRAIRSGRRRVSNCGAFNGYSSLLYADLHLSNVLNEKPPEFNRTVFDTLRWMIRQDKHFDLVSGSAGVLIVCLRLADRLKTEEIWDLAALAASHIKIAAIPQQTGIAWPTVPESKFPLVGLAHGTAGIAWALAEWAERSGDPEAASLARRAMAYEEAFFDPHLRTWVDARDGQPTCFWCYGAPGIALASSRMQHILGVDRVRKIKAIAIDAIWRLGRVASQCLCHGTLGNLEILTLLGTEADDQILAAASLELLRSDRWNCGLPLNLANPGLMNGIAGIGLSCLRYYNPDRIPSVLDLSGPLTLA